MRVKHPDLTLKELGILAGYCPTTPVVAAARALKAPAVVARIADLMNAHPVLTDAGLARKMAEGLEASKTEFFTHEAVVGEEPVIGADGEPVIDKKTKLPKTRLKKELEIITRDTVDYATRHRYLESALKVKGHLHAGLDIKAGVADGISFFSLQLGERTVTPIKAAGEQP